MKKIQKIISIFSAVALVFQIGAPIANATHRGFTHVTSSAVVAQDITRTNATICFTLNGAGYGKVHYGATTSYGQSFQEEAASSCGKIIRLTGLVAGTTYHYKIVSWPSQGTEELDGESSADFIFSTPASDTIPPGSVADGKANLNSAYVAISTTHNSVSFNWKAPGDDGWNTGAGPNGYIVKYQKRTGTLFQGPNDGGFWNSAPTMPASQMVFTPTIPGPQMGGTQSLTISGLEPSTQYRFGVLSVDAAGNQSSVPGIWDLDTTAAPAPVDTFAPPPVTGLTANSTTQSSISIQWIAPWDPGINSVPQAAARYEVRYNASQISTEPEWQIATLAPGAPTPRTGGQTEVFTITGLSSDKTYYIAVRAFDSAGNYSNLATLTASTPAPPPIDTTPPSISGIVAVSTSNNFAEIKYILDESAYVKLEYTASGGITLSTPEQNISVTEPNKTNSIYLVSLSPGTLYTYQIFARNPVNLTTRSALLSFQTQSETSATSTPPVITPPTTQFPTVSNAQVSNVYSNSAIIQAASDQNGYMRVEYGTSSQYGNFTSWSPITAYSTATTPPTLNTFSFITVSGLLPDTIYYGKLHVKNSQDVLSPTFITFQWKTLLSGQTPTPTPTPTPPPTPVPPTNNTLPSGTAGLTVFVKSPDGNAVEGATVGLSEKTNAPRWASGITNINGEYTFPKTIPGLYELGIAPPPIRTDLEGTMLKVTLADNSSISQFITLPKRSTPVPTPTEPLFIYNATPTNPSADGTEMYITWTTNKPSTSRVEYGITAAMASSVAYSAYTINHSVLLKNLEPKMTYYFKVFSVSQGMTAFSEQYTFQPLAQGQKIPFGLNEQTLYPGESARDVPTSIAQLHIEFTRPIDMSLLPQTVIDVRPIGDTSPISGTIQPFNNGFDYKLFESLKANTAYNVTIRGIIRDTTGAKLDKDYFYTFSTASGDSGTGAIKGKVKDAYGNGIAQASVSLTNSSNSFNRIEYTTLFGEFVFTNLKPDTYIFTAYPPKTYAGFTASNPVKVLLGAQEKKELEIVLAQSVFMIKGTVLFADKTPVSDAEVVAYRKNGPGSAWAEVNGAGEYCMIVSPGTWTLSVQPRQMYIMPYESSVRRGPPQSPCSPGNFNIAQKSVLLKTAAIVAQYPAQAATSVGIPAQIPFHGNWFWKQSPQEVVVGDPGAPAKYVNFEVQRVLVTTITGRVMRTDGLALSPGSVSIRLMGTIDTRSMMISVQSLDGKFQSPIAPGTYQVFADSSDPELTPPDIQPISITEGETQDIGVIMLGEANLTIQGKVMTNDGSPAPRHKIGAWKQSTSETRFAITDEEGLYIMKVSRGDWIVGIVPSPVQQYTVIEPPKRVRVEKGIQSVANFTLALNDSIVNGLVKNKQGAILTEFFGYAVARLKDGTRQPVAGAPVERGQFTLRLKKGDYALFLEAPPNAPPISVAPVSISLSEGEQKSVVFEVSEKRAHLSGKLINENGTPVTGVPFKVFTTGMNGTWHSADVDIATGTYKLTLGPGIWLVDFDIGDTSEYEKTPFRGVKVNLTKGEDRTIDFGVRKTTAMIRGKAIDSQGTAVPNVWVAAATESFSKFSEKTAQDLEYLNGAYTDKNGVFEISVRAGTYFVRSFLPPSFSLINPEEQKISVKGGKTVDVTLVFRPISVSIIGQTSMNGKPSWAYIWAWSDTGGFADTTSDNNGMYTLRVSPNDVWHIAALSEQHRDAFKSSEAVLIAKNQTKIAHNIDLTPLNVKLSEPVSVSGEADKLSVASNNEGVKLAVPANAANADGALTLSITPQIITPSQGASRVIGFGYDLAVRTGEGRQINSFNSDLTVSMPYKPNDIKKFGIKPLDLSLQYWDETRYAWQPVRNAVVNEKAHTITGSVNHLTRFAIIAATNTAPPKAPKVSLEIQKKGVSFSWNLAKGKAKIKYVKLYRSAVKGMLGKVMKNNITRASVSDTKAKRGKQYYYTIRTVDIFGNESVNTKQVAATAL